ncbi:ATP-binding protein [Ruminococcus sp.]|uniref:ATP-binding protein n=1 Tax=Ruminococcus sp. TaxID=41978 RepID=UPI003AF0B13D
MKRIKMLLYGEPGVGKSVFALKAPKPFFVCTDGNYEWLDEFGADPNAHKNVSSWADMKDVLESDFDGYETVVVDLLEDGFKWCEQEYCVRNKIEHVSDVGYGKAYDATRNEFFISISKLLSMDKHVILICHGITFTTKDRRGVEHTRYAPSSRIPDKVLDMIEGRVRYCLRCYTAAEEEPDGKITKKRFLSLVPKENEFGIIRGVDENTIPHDIPLDFDEFARAIKLNLDIPAPAKTSAPAQTKQKPAKAEPAPAPAPAEETKPEETSAPETAASLDMKAKLAALKAKKANLDNTTEAAPVAEPQPAPKQETPVATGDVTTLPDVEVKVSENAPYEDNNIPQTPAAEPVQETVTVQPDDKLAAIKAKLAAMKAKK